MAGEDEGLRLRRVSRNGGDVRTVALRRGGSRRRGPAFNFLFLKKGKIRFS